MKPEHQERIIRARQLLEWSRYRSAHLHEELDDALAQVQLAKRVLEDVEHFADLMKDAP